MAVDWNEEGDRFTFDDITAERAPDDNAFVIASFGAQPDADHVFSGIKAARRFGMIRLRIIPETKATIESLTGDGRIKCVRTIGTEHPELGVMAIKAKP